MILINRSKSAVRSKKRGVAFIIAVLVSSVALAVGMGVYQRTYKELLLGSFWKQTQVAFSATASGLECAKYRDSHPVSTSCFGTTFTWSPVDPGAWSPADLSVAGGCVKIKVTRYTPVPPDVKNTIVEALGYNDTSCGGSGGRVVERSLTDSYTKL